MAASGDAHAFCHFGQATNETCSPNAADLRYKNVKYGDGLWIVLCKKHTKRYNNQVKKDGARAMADLRTIVLGARSDDEDDDDDDDDDESFSSSSSLSSEEESSEHEDTGSGHREDELDGDDEEEDEQMEDAEESFEENTVEQ